MELQEFIEQFAEQFDDTDASELQPETDFKELDEWSSLASMSVIAMVRTQYGKMLTGKEIRSCTTIQDLFNLLKAK